MPSEPDELVAYRQVQGHRLRFTWEGGEYIDIAFGLEHPHDVINVWDVDQPRYYPDAAGLVEAIDAWVADLEPGEIQNYREATRH